MTVFYDFVAKGPYHSEEDMRAHGMGGSEAQLLRITQALPRAQRRFSLLEDPVKTDRVVFMRTLRNARGVFDRHGRDCRYYLWLHDIQDEWITHQWDAMLSLGVTMICGSKWHKTNTQMAFAGRGLPLSKLPPIQIVPNAVVVPEIESNTYNAKDLYFLSSPIKGLKRALELFKLLKAIDPEYSLYVSNPGYMDPATSEIEAAGATNLGSLPHAEIMSRLATGMCLFYPNTVFPETFGMVMAEANALGVPVIAHSFGASSETLSDGNYPLDCRDNRKVVDTVLAWTKERPSVKRKEAFTLQNVIKEWERVLK